MPEGADLETVLDAAVGLTRMEAENAFSLSLVREGRITASAVWELKTQTLKKSGLLSLYRGTEDFSRLGGLAALKAFCKRALLQPHRGNPLKRPRGVLLALTSWLWEIPILPRLGQGSGPARADFGRGQFDGFPRGSVRGANSACSPNPGRDGSLSGHDRRSGESLCRHQRQWRLRCLVPDVWPVPYVARGSRVRRVRGLHCQRCLQTPAGVRTKSERFDGLFFLDLPSREEKDAIWNIYLDLYEINRDQRLPDDTNWTGAEVKSCCRLSALLDVPLVQAAQNVVPVAVTAAESVERLRSWANGRCLSANNPGLYKYGKSAKSGSRRNVSRDSSQN